MWRCDITETTVSRMTRNKGKPACLLAVHSTTLCCLVYTLQPHEDRQLTWESSAGRWILLMFSLGLLTVLSCVIRSLLRVFEYIYTRNAAPEIGVAMLFLSGLLKYLARLDVSYEEGCHFQEV